MRRGHTDTLIDCQDTRRLGMRVPINRVLSTEQKCTSSKNEKIRFARNYRPIMRNTVYSTGVMSSLLSALLYGSLFLSTVRCMAFISTFSLLFGVRVRMLPRYVYPGCTESWEKLKTREWGWMPCSRLNGRMYL